MKKSDIKKVLENAGLKMPSSILSVGSDSKTVKGEQLDYLTAICYLIPDYTLCPASKLAKCDIACLVTAGLASVYQSVNAARLNKTKIYKQFPDIFYHMVKQDIIRLQNRAKKLGLSFCIRLNGTSDIDHSAFIATMPEVQFYDYTKMVSHIAKRNELNLKNYHLTFSYSGANTSYLKHVERAIALGANVAVVFSDKKLPNTFYDLPVISGDDSDLRFLDYKVLDQQAIIGLYAKGKAKKDNTGFVVQTNTIQVINL